MWVRCCIPASPPGRRRWRPPSIPAHPGPDVLAAVVAGYEVTIRVGLSVQPGHFQRGFQSTGTCDVFGTAAAAGRLLFGNADERILAAVGLAGSYSSGVAQFYYSGASGKRIQAAHAAQSGVAAALLTQHGFAGPVDMIEGTGGFARAYADGFNPAIIEDGLGDAVPAHGRAGEIARRGRARRRRHRCDAGAAAAIRLLRRRHRLDAARHSQGDPGPAHQSASGRSPGGADVPAVQRRARLAFSAGGRTHPDAGGGRL